MPLECGLVLRPLEFWAHNHGPPCQFASFSRYDARTIPYVNVATLAQTGQLPQPQSEHSEVSVWEAQTVEGWALEVGGAEDVHLALRWFL